MRTIEELKREVIALVTKYPTTTEREIGEKLSMSPRFTARLLDDMMNRGELQLNV